MLDNLVVEYGAAACALEMAKAKAISEIEKRTRGEFVDAVLASSIPLDELFRWIISVGGVVTGEHGIGLAKKPWWPLAANAEVRALHQTLKRALDPRGILNPGKFLDESS